MIMMIWKLRQDRAAGKPLTAAIASEAARLAYCVVDDTKTVTAASALLHGEYGEKDLFIGIPCVIGKNGLKRQLNCL